MFKFAKILVSMAFFASFSFAQWTPCTGDYAGYCKWGGPTGTGCDQLAIQSGESCVTKYNDCIGGSTLYSDAACTVYKAGIEPDVEATGCCKWDNPTENPDGKCYTMWTAKEATDCNTGTNTFWAGACPDAQGTCPGGTSSPSGASSSSATVATGPEKGFFITQFNNSPTAFGSDNYPFVGTYSGVTITNPEDQYGLTVRNEGVGKLKEATLAPEDSYGAAFIGIKNNTTSPSIADCNSGFSYWYKGAAHEFKIEIDPSVCGSEDKSNSFHRDISASLSNWTKATIATSSLTPGWEGADCEGKLFDATKATQMAWELKTGVSGDAGQTVSLMIDDVICLQSDGPNIYSTAPDNCITINSGWDGTTCSTSSSSTTTTNSSSSGTNASPSSSSVYIPPGQYLYCVYASAPAPYCLEGPFSSCGTGGDLSNSCPWPVTSIKVSKVAKANGVQLIKNGVSLQVTKNATLEVYNLSGKLFRKVNFASGVYSVQLADLPKGLYVAKVQFGAKKEVLYVPIR